MSIIHRLGNKLTGNFHRLGHKLQEAEHTLGRKVHTAVHYAAEHAGQVSKIAGKVGRAGGLVSKVATAALPFTAEIPIVGEVVAGAGAAGKLLQAGSRGVRAGAAAVSLLK